MGGTSDTLVKLNFRLQVGKKNVWELPQNVHFTQRSPFFLWWNSTFRTGAAPVGFQFRYSARNSRNQIGNFPPHSSLLVPKFDSGSLSRNVDGDFIESHWMGNMGNDLKSRRTATRVARNGPQFLSRKQTNKNKMAEPVAFLEAKGTRPFAEKRSLPPWLVQLQVDKRPDWLTGDNYALTSLDGWNGFENWRISTFLSKKKGRRWNELGSIKVRRFKTTNIICFRSNCIHFLMETKTLSMALLTLIWKSI